MGVSNKSLAAGAALLLVGGLLPSLAAPPQRDAERGVRRALIRLNGLLAERDPAIAEEFLDSPETLLIGAAATESARGRAEVAAHFTRIFARPETLAFSWRRVEVSVRGAVAWLFAEGELVRRKDGAETREPYRLSGVLEQHGGRWLWRMFHGSQPAA
jgi:ketosteroid isomerase-like protein